MARRPPAVGNNAFCVCLTAQDWPLPITVPNLDVIFDAVVVGGGPAGSASAAVLARAGWRVTVLEGRQPGREKTCGHCLATSAAPSVRRLGLETIIDAVTEDELHEVRIEPPAGWWRRRSALVAELPRGHHAIARLVDRRRMDEALLDLARRSGATVERPGRVVGLERHAAEGSAAPRHPWVVVVRGAAGRPERRLGCRLLVGADGLGSAVARFLGWGPRTPGRAFGFSGRAPREAIPDLPRRQIRLCVLRGGYVGAVRMPSGREASGDDQAAEAGEGAIHIAALVRRSSAARAPADFLRKAAANHSSLDGLARFAEATSWTAAGPMPWRPKQVSAAGAVLVGDAAGFVEPFTGEGMSWALTSAALLDEALAGRGPDQAGGFDERMARCYHQLWRESLLGAHQRCAWVARLIARPALLGAVLGVAPSLVSSAAHALMEHRNAGPTRRRRQVTA